MSDNNQEVKAAEAIGDQARAFIDSELGQYLNGCMKQDVELAKHELLVIDAWKFMSLIELQTAISRIQDKVNHAISLQEYLDQAIVSGEQASHQLEQQDDD